jgi:hypothetical protein
MYKDRRFAFQLHQRFTQSRTRDFFNSPESITPGTQAQNTSVTVRVSLEEKEMRVFMIALALTHTLTLFHVGPAGLEPATP